MAAHTVVQGPVPDWIQDMFKQIDSKDLKGASAYFTDDCDSHFMHFSLQASRRGILRSGVHLDAQFKQYHHHLEECWDGPDVVMFGGRVEFKLRAMQKPP